MAIVIVIFGAPSVNAAHEILAGPYLQNPTDTSITIIWVTSAKSTATVEYGTGESLDNKKVATADGQIDANITVHRVKVTGLTPETQYAYRVISTEIEDYQPYKVTYGQTINSPAYSFQTLSPKKSDCSFIVLNDIHSRIETMKKEIEIADKKPYDMVFLNGDIINDPMSEKQVVENTLMPATELFASKIPFMLVRGNHETRGALSRNIKDYFDLPNNKYYFSFQHGPVYFIVMDSGEDKEDSHWAYSRLNAFDAYRNEQAEWLKKEIKKKEFRKAKYRVAITHIPLFGPGTAYGTLDCRKKWGPLLNKGRIDLHISGHRHRATVLEPVAGEHDYPIFIGGGPDENNLTVIRVDANAKKLTVTMTGSDGNVIGEKEIKP